METIIYLTAGPLFLISIITHLYIRFGLRREYNTDLDDYYWEFEDRQPALVKYNKWSRLTFIVAVLSALMLFIAAVVI
ncbi:MAG: hypothetical protein JXB29_06165 [Sedimentisphaerales bacterium]|nr:hypothetical protein [Sedimentisphaerales bacterium]